MPKITVLPHEELCPHGTEFECRAGAGLCDQLRANGVALEQACERSCVCTTCHVLVREGFSSLRGASDAEEDQLGKAWGLEATSRLSCQVRVAGADLVIEIPRYTLNIVGESR
ncbi:MAG: ISC system 2Fe-2S type ferredoxin [Steroidobacteraceae bacterium]|jgi:ferredoxin, 2Fe-2S